MNKKDNIPKHFDLQDRASKLQQNAFIVPENYFENSRKAILLRRELIESSQRSFSVPDNYQQDLSNRILSKVKRLSDLPQLPEKDGFTVPDGYFDGLSARIMENRSIRTTKTERPVKMRWISYAAAACLLLGTGIFSFLRYNDPVPPEKNPSALIDQVETDDIIDYLAMYSEPGDLVYLSDQLPEESDGISQSFSSEAIEAYLEGEF